MHTKDSSIAPYVAGSDTALNFAADVKPGSTLIIGLSGGPDSVYLLHLLLSVRESLDLSLIAVHLDHEWRDTSQDDVVFCEKLCAQLNVTFVTKKASELNESFESNGSQEQLGRNMRRFFLEQVRQEYNAHAIVLAHHQDDQLETFFINIIRGTTITGLCGMKSHDGYFVRPLLGTSKQEILAYLSEHQIPYQTDPTNESNVYLRNRIRASVIPALTACDNRAKLNILRAMHNIQDTEQFIKKVTEQALHEVTHTENAGSPTSDSSLDLTRFFNLDLYLQKRVLHSWLSLGTNGTSRSSKAFLDEILRFLRLSRGGTHQISPLWALIKKQNHIFLKK